MKKNLLLLIALLFAFSANAQLTTATGDMGDIKLFKLANAPMTIIMPSGYPFDSASVEIYANGVILNDSIPVVISGDTIKFTIPKSTIQSLGKKENYLYVKVDTTYQLGSSLISTLIPQIPNGSVKQINLPTFGNIRVYMIGEASAAIQAAANAASAAVISIAARDSSKVLMDSTNIYNYTRTKWGTMAQLRASTDDANIWNITAGKASGVFIYDPSDGVSIDDGALVLVQSSKRFKRQFDYVTPEMYGASGLGISDDKIYLQKAFESGKQVYLLGKYYISAPIIINLSSNKTLNIKGFTGNEIIINGLYDALNISTTDSTGEFSVSGVTIKGVMDSALDDPLYANAICTNYVNNVEIFNCNFNNIYGNGMFINYSRNTKIYNNILNNCGGLNPTIDIGGYVDHYGDGITTWNKVKGVISNNKIIFDAPTKGFYGRAGIVADNFSQATIRDNYVVGYSRGIHIEHGDNNIVDGNYVNSKSALVLAVTKNNIISNNQFYNENTEALPSVISQYFINLYGDVSNNIFTQNIIKVDTVTGFNPDWGMLCLGSNNKFERNIIEATIFTYGTTGYVFEENNIKSPYLLSSNSDAIFHRNTMDIGRYSESAMQNTFTENSIYNTWGYSTYILGYGSNGFKFNDNKIYLPKQAMFQNAGAFIGEISGNTIYTDGSTIANFWTQYTPIPNNTLSYSKRANIEIKSGVENSTMFFYSGIYRNGINKEKYDTAYPVTGTWKIGDTVINIAPSAGGYTGWKCTAAGTPGTWKGYGAIAP